MSRQPDRGRIGRPVLVLAGDPGLGAAVCEELDRYHVRATAAASVEEARKRLGEACYDAFVVDLSLPGGAGYRFVADLRAAGRIQPVLLLSAPHAPEDLLSVQRGWPGWRPAVREGLHDVPAVLQALLRHERSDAARRLRYAGLMLDRFERRACVDGVEVALTPAEFALLEQLLVNAEHLVTREALLAAVWQHEGEPASNALAVHLCHVRKKLHRQEDRVVIETVRGRGCVLKRRPYPSGAAAGPSPAATIGAVGRSGSTPRPPISRPDSAGETSSPPPSSKR